MRITKLTQESLNLNQAKIRKYYNICDAKFIARLFHIHFISFLLFFFFFNDPATTEIYTLSLHDALPISSSMPRNSPSDSSAWLGTGSSERSEEHTSELQSLAYLVCRLLLEKKKKKKNKKKKIKKKNKKKKKK